VLAAREGIALGDLTAQALETEIRRRESSELRRVAMARPEPMQTR
jgi:hypothetical protein